MGSALSKREIMIVVNRYIGVEGGYLGDFSYRTHAEFYPLYCELDIDPYENKEEIPQLSLLSKKYDYSMIVLRCTL